MEGRFAQVAARCAAILLGGIAGSVAANGDSIALPPARETFASPGGQYELLIAMRGAPGEWARRGAEATLRSTGNRTSAPLWQQPLPHSYRPRFALVSDDGTTALFDQWINVLGPHAVTVIDRAGKVIASHAFDDVAAALGIGRARLAAGARLGPWMQSRPSLDPSGTEARVEAGGRTLAVRLADGALRAMP